MESYFDAVSHADATFQLGENSLINQTDLDRLENIDEIDSFTGRLFWMTYTKLPDQKDYKTLLLVGLDEDIKWPKVYNYTIEAGKNFNQNDDNLSVVIDTEFAEINDLTIGDKIEVDGLNGAKLEIYGTCNAPEFLAATSNPEYLFPIEGSMTFLFLSKNTLKNYIIDYFTAINASSSEDMTNLIQLYKNSDYNNIAVTFKSDDSHSEGMEAIKDYLENDYHAVIQKSEKFEDTYAYTLMNADLSDSTEFLMVMTILMFITGILIVYVIFNRYIQSQKQQIGILEALGYTKKDIMKYFLFNIIIISIVSIPIGIFVGFMFGYLMINIMITEFVNVAMFSFPFLFLPEQLWFGIIGGLLMIFLSIYIPVRRFKKKDIVTLIYQQTEIEYRIKKPKNTKKKTQFINGKLILHNAFRNKKRLALSIVAMTFSLLMVSSTQTTIDSFLYSINRTFKTEENRVEPTENWDLNVQFQNSLNLSISESIIDNIKDIEDIKNVVVYSKGIITVKGEEGKDFLVLGIDLEKNDDIHHFTWKNKNEDNAIPTEDNEIVISSVYSVKFGKELGDTLTIKNAAENEFKFKIVGIHSDMVLAGYVTEEKGEKIFHNEQDFIDGLFVVLESGADKEKIIEDIYDLGNIETIFDSEELGPTMANYINDYTAVYNTLILYVFLVSFFVVLYNSVMNIYDKNYEYGILRSLGYSKRKIFKFILIENYLQGLVPIFLALVFTQPLAFQMVKIYEEEFPIELAFSLPAILLITITPLLLYLLGSLIGLRTVFKQNLYEQVQTRFVG